jgi:hypothetical protein
MAERDASPSRDHGPSRRGVRPEKAFMLSGLAALIFASAFAGAALYINLVEQPARLALDDKAMMSEWKPSDRRGFALLGGLAIVSGLLGLAAFRGSGDVRWLIGAIVIVASWPYTYFLIVPLNNRLLANASADASPDARELVTDWGFLEWGLSAIGVVAAATFAWALT